MRSKSVDKPSNMAKLELLKKKIGDNLSFTIKKPIRGRVISLKLGNIKMPLSRKKFLGFQVKIPF